MNTMENHILYKEKWSLHGYTLFFFLRVKNINFKNINCGYLLEPPYGGGSKERQQSMFGAKVKKLSQIINWQITCEEPHYFDI